MKRGAPRPTQSRRRLLLGFALACALLVSSRFIIGLSRRSVAREVVARPIPLHADAVDPKSEPGHTRLPSTAPHATTQSPATSDPERVSVVIAIRQGEDATAIAQQLAFSTAGTLEFVFVAERGVLTDATRDALRSAVGHSDVKFLDVKAQHPLSSLYNLFNHGAEAADATSHLLAFFVPYLRLRGDVLAELVRAVRSDATVGIASCTTLADETELPTAHRNGRRSSSRLVVRQRGYSVVQGGSGRVAIAKRLSGLSPRDARAGPGCEAVDMPSLQCMVVTRRLFYDAKGFGAVVTVGDLASTGFVGSDSKKTLSLALGRYFGSLEKEMSLIDIGDKRISDPKFRDLLRSCFDAITTINDIADRLHVEIVRTPLTPDEAAHMEGTTTAERLRFLSSKTLDIGGLLGVVARPAVAALDMPAAEVAERARENQLRVLTCGAVAEEVPELMSSHLREGRRLADGASFVLDTSNGIAQPIIDKLHSRLPMQSRHRSSPLRVVWDSFCCGCCGFSNEIVHFVVPLSQRQHVDLIPQPSCFCNGFPAFASDTIQRMQLTYERYVMERAADDEVVIWVSHTDPMSFRNSAFARRKPDYVVGRSMYEFTRIDENWVDAANEDCDEVWVPAEWVRRTFIASGVKAEKLFVVPEAIDTNFFDPSAHSPFSLPLGSDPDAPTASWRSWCNKQASGKPYAFYTNFKWEDRKGWDVLFEAYNAAFKPDDPVSLYIHTKIWFSGGPETWGDARNTTFLQVAVAEFAAQHLGIHDLAAMPHFCFVTEDLEEAEVARFYRSVDAFVLPTRGEGWGLPTIQAMAMALPTISTRWGGQAEFLSPNTSFAIPIDSVEEIPRDSVYRWRAGKKWAQPSVSETARLMRLVFDHQEKARAVGARAREVIVQRFSETSIAELVDSHLERIRKKVLQRRLLHSG